MEKWTKEFCRDYQYNYYHKCTKMKVICERCGSKTTRKNMVNHIRTPKCKKLVEAAGAETFKERVEKIETIFQELSLEDFYRVRDCLRRSSDKEACPWGFGIFDFFKKHLKRKFYNNLRNEKIKNI